MQGGIRVAISVHLADDQTMFREGLAAILGSREGVEVVGQSSTGEEATALVRETKPVLVITQLDPRLKTAEEIISGIHTASPDSRIVVLTAFDNLHVVKAVSEMDIDAYLHKSSLVEDLSNHRRLGPRPRRKERDGGAAPKHAQAAGGVA